jgi:hypothetical protein
MANAIPPVLVELQLETAKIKEQLTGISKKFDDFGATVSKQTSFLSSFKAAAAGVFAGNVMTQGLQMVKGALQGAVLEAQAYEKATAQLNAGIKSTGNLAGLSVEGLQAQAAALESLSAQDEIAIMKNQGLLQTFTNVRNVVGEGNDIFDQATLAMLNMGAKMGDNAGSAMQLGKALNDPLMGMNALRRVGVVFTEQQKQSIKTMVAAGDIMGAQKIILQELEVEFGGAAKAAGDTFAGAVFRAKDKVADFARTLITNLQPIVLSVGKTIGDLWNKYLSPLLKIINDNKDALLIFVGVLGTAYAAFKLYGVILAVVKTAQSLYAVAQVLMAGGQLASIASTNGLAASMLRLNAIMSANPIGLIVAALALVAAGFVIAWNNSETFRKVMISVGKAGLSAFSYLLEFLGLYATGVLKVVTGPMRLLLKGLEMLGVKGAGAALKDINGAIDNVGKFFDGAAKKVESYKKTLDGLADKKIKLPSFGAAKVDETTVVGAEAPGGGLTAAQVAAAKAAAKEKAKLLDKANKDVQVSYEKMNKVIAEAQEKGKEITDDYNKKVSSIKADHAKQETKARADHLTKQTSIYKDFAEKEVSIRKDYANKVIQLEVDAENKRAGIIQRSKDLLKNAFQNATKFDLASLMKDSDGSGATMVQRMKEKLTKILDLQRKAGELASKGFSQGFIQDVISQGPDAGNAMADSILSAAPETVKEMQSLYGKIQDVSENGMNKLADQMYDQMGLATQELREQYEQVSIDLTAALLKAEEIFAESIEENTKELNKALEANNKDLEEKLADIQVSLQEALLDAQEAYNEAIADLEKDTKKKLADLQDELLKTVAIIKELAGAKAAVAALAGSPAAPFLAGVTPTSVTPTYNPLKGNTLNSNTYAGQGTGANGAVTITQNISYPTASASEISAQTLSAIKFGTTSARTL